MMCILRELLLLTFISVVWCKSDSYLYYSDYGANAVYRLDLDSGERTTLPLTGLSNPLALDYDPNTEYLYIANTRLHANNVTKFFLKYHLTTGSMETHYLPRSYLVSTMALDPVSQLIYYAERSAQVIIAMTTDFKHSAVIINEELEKPSIMVLDVVRHNIYWCDWNKASPQIGTANLDGTKQEKIIVSNLVEPYPLALDPKADLLYWADHSPNRTVIEMSKTNGRKRQTLVNLKEDDFIISLTVDENYVYWIIFKEGIIHRTQKHAPYLTDTIGEQYNNTDFRSLKVVKKSPTSPGTNVCGSPGRGGCQHVCIPTEQSRVCRCAEGHILQPDGTSCREASFTRGLVTTDVNRRTLLVHDLDSDVTKRLTEFWHDHDNPLDVAFDNLTKEVYWQDRYKRGIYKSCIHTPCYKLVKEYEKESQMTTLALDTGKKMIYISDFGLKKLFKLSYSGSWEEVLVTNLTTHVSSIALDTSRRQMYWANTQVSIEMANMDTGSNRKVLLHMAGVYVSGMEVDSQAGLLYILDHIKNRIQVYDLNKHSKLRTIYQTEGTQALYGIAIGDGILYFSDRNKQSIHELDLGSNQTIEYGRRSYKRVVGMTYFNLGSPHRGLDNDTYQGLDNDTYRGPEIAAVSSGGPQNRTLIIALSVTFGGLIIFILLVIFGIVLYKRKHYPSTTTVEPESAPPTDPPVPLDMLAGGQRREPPVGVYGEPFCEPDDDELKKEPLPHVSVTSFKTSILPAQLAPTKLPPYQRF